MQVNSHGPYSTTSTVPNHCSCHRHMDLIPTLPPFTTTAAVTDTWTIFRHFHRSQPLQLPPTHGPYSATSTVHNRCSCHRHMDHIPRLPPFTTTAAATDTRTLFLHFHRSQPLQLPPTHGPYSGTSTVHNPYSCHRHMDRIPRLPPFINPAAATDTRTLFRHFHRSQPLQLPPTHGPNSGTSTVHNHCSCHRHISSLLSTT